MVKTIKDIFLWNRKADDLNLVFSIKYSSAMFKWCPWIDLNLFYGKVKFGPFAFVWEKVKTMDFSETIVVYDIKVGRYSHQ